VLKCTALLLLAFFQTVVATMSSSSSSAYNMENLRKNLSIFGSRVKESGNVASKTLGERITAASSKMKEYFATPTQADQLVEAATSESLVGPDWGKNLEICDMVNAQRMSSTVVVKAILRRLMLKQPHVQMLTLSLLEMAAKNCDTVFQDIASEKVLDEMVKMADDPAGDITVREKTLRMIEAWGEATEDLRYLPIFEETYKSLKARGVRFPGRDAESLAPIFTPPASVPTAQPTQVPAFAGKDPTETVAVARNSCELLSTVLSSAPQQEALKDDLTIHMVQQCQQSLNAVRGVIQRAGDNETLLFEALAVHDDLEKVLKKHEEMVTGVDLPASEEPAQLVAVQAGEGEDVSEPGLVRHRGGGGGGAAAPQKPKGKDDDMIVF